MVRTSHTWALFVALALALSCAGRPGPAAPPAPEPQAAQPPPGPRTPVVFVSGVTGTVLRDPGSGERVWGGSTQLFRPRDGGYRLALPLSLSATSHPQFSYEPVAPILQLRLPGWTKQVYRPLVERFESAGYRRGSLESPRTSDGLFFFNYDWRHGNLESARELDRQLEALSRARGSGAVDLVCQSNAAKICRWLTKYRGLDLAAAQAGEAWESSYRIRRLALVGASNNGALRVLQLLIRGRSYVPLVGRKFRPELFFTLRPLFEDLPAARDDLFFDERGRKVAIDLFDANQWEELGWSIFGKGARRRLARRSRPDLFGDREARLDYLREQLRQAETLQTLLARDAPHFPATEYYLLENASAPTVDRALVTRESGDWRTYFLGDRRVDRHPALRRLAAAPGDGHAVLASQRSLSPQETRALVATARASGGHFEAVVEPQGLDAILGFLAD